MTSHLKIKTRRGSPYFKLSKNSPSQGCPPVFIPDVVELTSRDGSHTPLIHKRNAVQVDLSLVFLPGTLEGAKFPQGQVNNLSLTAQGIPRGISAYFCLLLCQTSPPGDLQAEGRARLESAVPGGVMNTCCVLGTCYCALWGCAHLLCGWCPDYSS